MKALNPHAAYFVNLPGERTVSLTAEESTILQIGLQAYCSEEGLRQADVAVRQARRKLGPKASDAAVEKTALKTMKLDKSAQIARKMHKVLERLFQ